jgi:hypothetical protein
MKSLNWSKYYHLRETQMNLPLQSQEPTQDEFQNRRDLYSTLVDVRENIDALRQMLDDEVNRIVNDMDRAASISHLDTPFHRTVMVVKKELMGIRDGFNKQIVRLNMRLDHEAAKEGTSLSRKNLTRDPQQDQNVGHEDWEKADRAQSSDWPDPAEVGRSQEF